MKLLFIQFSRYVHSPPFRTDQTVMFSYSSTFAVMYSYDLAGCLAGDAFFLYRSVDFKDQVFSNSHHGYLCADLHHH